MSTEVKFNNLCNSLVQPLRNGLIVAFSGGVDSSFLLWTANQVKKENGGKLLAVTTISASMPNREKEDAKAFAFQFGIDHQFENSLEIENPEYIKNDANRCYHCKSELFRLSKELAQKLNFSHIAYGYTFSDRGDHRPGHRAAIENGVLYPLDLAELTKSEIRALMRLYDIPYSEKPASPCLSSRIMLGISVTPERLLRIEKLEDFLSENNFREFRVRYHEESGKPLARIELAKVEFDRFWVLRHEIEKSAKSLGFQWVTLDLCGYKTGGGV